jgi:hypothetical protein
LEYANIFMMHSVSYTINTNFTSVDLFRSQSLVMQLSQPHSFHGVALPKRQLNKAARSSIGPKEYHLLEKALSQAKRRPASSSSALPPSRVFTKHSATQKPHPVSFQPTEQVYSFVFKLNGLKAYQNFSYARRNNPCVRWGGTISNIVCFTWPKILLTWEVRQSGSSPVDCYQTQAHAIC